jgi:hypothetical protein
MSSGIDERIVEMVFRGGSFFSGVQSAITALTSLTHGLNNLKGAEGNINNLDAAGKRFSLSGMAQGVESLASKFGVLGVAGITAISNITNRAINAGITLAKALTIDPIKAGLDVYETKINAIQTILANTQAEGTNLKQVTAALNQLNTYANLTVYNFGQMAKNIGTFTAAGVNLKDSVSSIKGIANLAALSGSSAEQASTGMYQLSQAIAAGVVKLQDWNSVVNAGFGGKVFQKALIDTARVNGISVDAMISKYGSFRQSLQSGWLTAKVLTQTLSEFTGDLSNKQLRAMGFTAAETAAIQKQAQVAVNSATQVRTISGLTQALKEEVATAWSKVFEAIIGNSTQATQTLSHLHSIAETALTSPINKLADLLAQFNHLGGRDLVIQGIGEAFHALSSVLSTVGKAFHDVFPSGGGGPAQGLISLAIAFQNFAAKLEPSKQTLAELRTIFGGLFSVIKIVIDVISALIGGITKVGPATKSAGGGFLSIVASIAQFITNIRKAIESGTALATFFNFLGKVIAFPVKILGDIIGALHGFGSAAGAAGTAATPIITKIADAFKGLFAAIGKAIQSGGISNVLNILNQLLLGGVLLSVKNFFGGLGKASTGGGFLSSIKESFENLTKTLESMQTRLKAGTLKEIAIAVALLAVSLIALSFVNVQNLIKALVAMTVVFTEMIGAIAVLSKIAGIGGVARIVVIAAALNLLATSVLILSGAVAILAQFSWTQLAKGLASIAVLLGILVTATLLMSANAKGLITSAIAMEVMALALNTLTLAVILLGKQNLASLAKGIGSIAVLLAILAGFNAISGAQLVTTAVAMVVLAGALEILANVVQKLGALSVGTLAKGLVAIAAGLLIIALAMTLMPPQMFVTAASLLVVAVALTVLSKALETLGGMTWGEIAKALVLLAGALVIIAAAMILMTEALPGAAALLVVAASLAILTPILIALSSIPWEGIAKGIVALAAVFVVIGLAGLLLTPLIPSLLLLGVAIGLLGVGILAAGAGVALFAVGLTGLAVAVAASGAAILAFVASILSLIPLALTKIGQGIILFANLIGKAGPAITNAFVAILTALLNGIIKVTPLAAKAFGVMLTNIIGVVTTYAPRVANTIANLILLLLNTILRYMPRFIALGVQILISFINGIGSKIGAVVAAAFNVVIAFINAVGAGALRLTRAGAVMIINFVNGLANQIRNESGALRSAALNLAGAIIDGMTFGLASKAGGVIGQAESLGHSVISALGRAVKFFSPSHEAYKVGAAVGDGLILGLEDSVGGAVSSADGLGKSVISSLSKTLSTIGDTVSSNIDLNPKITPVLDLTAAKKGFNDLSSLSKDQLIAATASTSTATSISAANAATAAALGVAKAITPTVQFIQNNTSPESLSTTTIYRQTKNQLSAAKGALSGNANTG